MNRPLRIVVLCQVYAPDPTGVGQYMTDACEALAARGHDVTVLTSARAYEDPSLRFPAREERAGVHVRRLGLSSFGRRSLPVRAIAALLFGVQCVFAGARRVRADAVLFTTAPPMIGPFALAYAIIWRSPLIFWAMDLNPDQLVALGRLSESSLFVRLLRWINRIVYARCSGVIALDRYMAERLVRAGAPPTRTVVRRLWPAVGDLHPVAREVNGFRARHAFGDRVVVMYSGNQTPSNPLDTLLDLALALRGDDRFRFVFIGGGGLAGQIDAFRRRHALDSVLVLPYQPREMLSESLSAGDVHVVSLGDGMVGVIHPCKVYNALAVGRPLLYFGPAQSHVGDLLAERAVGWRVPHGDVEAAAAILRAFAGIPAAEAAALQAGCRALVEGPQAAEVLLDAFCGAIETVVADGNAAHA